MHGYTDDHAIKTSFQSGSTTLGIEAAKVMENTLASIKSWMSENRIKMKDFRAEFIIIRFTETTQKSIRLHQPVKNPISDNSNIFWNSPSLGINSRYRLS